MFGFWKSEGNSPAQPMEGDTFRYGRLRLGVQQRRRAEGRRPRETTAGGRPYLAGCGGITRGVKVGDPYERGSKVGT